MKTKVSKVGANGAKPKIKAVGSKTNGKPMKKNNIKNNNEESILAEAEILKILLKVKMEIFLFDCLLIKME